MPWIDHPDIYAPRVRVTHSNVKCTLNEAQDELTIEGSGGFCHLYVDSSLPWQTYEEALYGMARGMAPSNVSYIMIPCKGATEPIPWVTLRAGPQTTTTSRLQKSSTSEAIELECRAANVSQYADELKRAFAHLDLIDPASGQPVPYVMRRIDWSSVGGAGAVVEAHIEAASDASISQTVVLEIRDRLPPGLPRLLPTQPGAVPERLQCLHEATSLGAHLSAYASRVFATSPGDACDGSNISNDFSWSVHPSPGKCAHHALVRYQWAVTDTSGNRNAAHLQVVVQDTTPPQWNRAGVTACMVVAAKSMTCVPESAWNDHVLTALSDACSGDISLTLTPRRRRLCKSISSCSETSIDWISETCSSSPWFSSNGDYADLEWAVAPRDACGNVGAVRSVRLVLAQHAAQCQRLGLSPL